MLDITLVAVGKLKTQAFIELTAEYLKRLQPFAKLRLVELPATSFVNGGQEKAKIEEGKRIADFLDKQKPSQIYLLAERGKMFTSVELADWFDKNTPLILIIGGALGFSEDLYKKYSQLSLSPLTFTHEMARVILLEQIYRATTILNKKDYHY